MLIFQQSRKNRRATAQVPDKNIQVRDIPQKFLRASSAILPEVSELQVVRHYTKLSQKNYSIDTQFYPLGSCTMKYNPRGVHRLASLANFLNRHPLALEKNSQGFLQSMYELQEILKAVTGMKGISLASMGGAQGEFAGVAMIRAYHDSRSDKQRTEIIIPDAAHGTNPASAAMCGYKVREIPTNKEGDLDMTALEKILGPQTAGIMLTNPSTLGVFERKIKEIANLVHAAGGLLYYDGANLNAILGKVRPGDMGFDVMHLNLHKTFATPHGGGGPGSGPVAVNERLLPFLPVPYVSLKNNYMWVTEKDCPQTIGRLGTFMGNAGVNLRAYIYARMLGKEGMHRVAEFATLNASYLQKRLAKAGFTLAYPKRRASHEFIVTLSKEKKNYGVTALDFAKRLLDYDFYAPTIYFPLLVPECMLIEPTETECKEELDRFADAMTKILQEAKTDPEKLRNAPYKLPVGRIDEVKAARELDLVWREAKS
jgi:glycine dehydrogenase subunit 2